MTSLLRYVSPHHLLRCLSLLVVISAATISHAANTVAVTEFVNGNNGNRVLLTDQNEIFNLKAGLAGAGWVEGSQLTMLAANSSGNPVYRFYGPSANSHFYTANPVEYELLRQPGTGWFYEGIDFNTEALADGACPATSKFPVYRYYNAGHVADNSTHRFSSDRNNKAGLEAAGWIDQGIAFCAVALAEPKVVRTTLYKNTFEVGLKPCDDSTLPLSGFSQCMSAINLPALTSYAGYPFLVQTTGTVTNDVLFARITGLHYASVYGGPNYWKPDGQPDPEAIVRHSFIQDDSHVCRLTNPGPNCSSFHPYGYYLNGSDSLGGSSSFTPMLRFPVALPMLGGVFGVSDKGAILPWQQALPLTLKISFSLSVMTLKRPSPQAHAYGHPSLWLYDNISGHRILLNILAYSTDPAPATAEADYFGIDVDTGAVIVSTAFRANPSFGIRQSGTASDCTTHTVDGQWVNNCGTSFSFLIPPQDVTKIIARARTLDPALSPVASNYAVERLTFKNEVVGPAEAGLTLTNLQLDVLLPN